jgi:acetoin utilization deacetylase AcuC-like enzyme
MVDQRRGSRDDAPWVLEGGRVMRGYENSRRLAELRSGLICHHGVRPAVADVTDRAVDRTLSTLHEPGYLSALKQVHSHEPVVMPQLSAPGLEPDIPVCAGLVAAAYEGVRTAITAARLTVAGARFTYALCRPPGHHAGPGWLGGYCYLNTAAAATQTLCEGGFETVGILDLDLHYPNGTAAIVAPMINTHLHSLHASPVTNVPGEVVLPLTDRERLVDFAESPSTERYLDAVAASIDALARSASVLILSLGYDTVIGDPHGCWRFSPSIFDQIGRVLVASRLPVCVIQEGGYALKTLAACSNAFATGLLDGAPA